MQCTHKIPQCTAIVEDPVCREHLTLRYNELINNINTVQQKLHDKTNKIVFKIHENGIKHSCECVVF